MPKQPNYIDKTYNKFEQIFNAPPVKQRSFAPPVGQRVRPPQNMPVMPVGAGRVPQVNAQPATVPEVPMEEQLPFAMKGKNNGT